MSIPSPSFPPPTSVHKFNFAFLVKLRNKNLLNGILKDLPWKAEELRINPLTILKFSNIVTQMVRNSEITGQYSDGNRIKTSI